MSDSTQDITEQQAMLNELKERAHRLHFARSGESLAELDVPEHMCIRDFNAAVAASTYELPEHNPDSQVTYENICAEYIDSLEIPSFSSASKLKKHLRRERNHIYPIRKVHNRKEGNDDYLLANVKRQMRVLGAQFDPDDLDLGLDPSSPFYLAHQVEEAIKVYIISKHLVHLFN